MLLKKLKKCITFVLLFKNLLIVDIIILLWVNKMNDEYIVEMFRLANDAFEQDEIPVAARVVRNNQIIGVGINSRHKTKNVMGHAEINAIEQACAFVGDWRLDECDLYVTLEPCMMCTGAILESRIKKVYYLCNRTNVRFKTSDYIDLIKIENVEYEDKYLKLLQLFFENKRN